MAETECSEGQLEFQGLGRRRVVADFDGGRITSDSGALLLREVESARKIVQRFSESFDDRRDQRYIEHTVLELVGQRVYGIALGYEDLNDHDQLRRDAAVALLVEKTDLTGEDRKRERDRGVPLAGKSTLNRVELTPVDGSEKSRYHKVACRFEEVEQLFLDVFFESHSEAPDEIIIDIDPTDIELHGAQEGRFYSGYYDEYCYLPLYIFCGDFLLSGRLRMGNERATVGALEELTRIVTQIRDRWPEVHIIIRGDSAFSRDPLMSWCEAQEKVDYIFGLARNARLLRKVSKPLERARRKYLRTGKPTRLFRTFRYRTLDSWSRSRWVVAKVEYLGKGANRRFVVTSLPADGARGRNSYEKVYCARGDMENRIKEQQLCLFADRASSSSFSANQLRVYYSAVAYVLVNEFRRVGLKGTQLARAQCSTIRTTLFRIGALIWITVRRVRFLLASGYPFKHLFRRVKANLDRAYASASA